MGVNSRRTVIIGAAVLIALVAFLGNVLYLKNVKERAYGEATLVKVFVVKKPIAKGIDGGQAIAQEMVRPGEIPSEFRPGSAISNIDDIRGKVAINALTPGQVLVDGQFVDQNVAQVTFAQRIPSGQVAVSVSVDQVHGVAGLLMPGDKVNIMVVNNDETNPNVSVLYQNVDILAIGTKAAPEAGDGAEKTSSQPVAADSGLITFSVPLEAAQRIAYIGSGLKSTAMYLTLVQPDTKPSAGQPPVVNLGNLAAVPVTPYPAG